MSLMSSNPVFSAAVLTVCVDPHVAEQAVRMINEMPWLVSSMYLDAYISDARRPYITPQSRAANACIALVDFDRDRDEAAKSTRYLQHVFGSKLTVIALAASREPEILLEAMRAGCKEFLVKPLQVSALQDCVSRLHDEWQAASVRPSTSGTMLSFMGAKGGVGSTTLAVHTAVYLAKSHRKKTLLIDTRAELGHVSIYLGLDGSRNFFHELVRNVRRLDSALLEASITHHASGLDVLSSPDSCGNMEGLDSDSISRTLEFLQSEYEYIVLDCPAELDDRNMAVMHASSKVYLVATPELGAVRDLSRYVDALTQDQRIGEKIHVVINRVASRFAVNSEQIEKAIKLPVHVKFTNCYTELVRSINLGEPVDPKGKSEFSVELLKWTADMAGVTTPASSGPATRAGAGFFRRKLVPST